MNEEMYQDKVYNYFLKKFDFHLDLTGVDIVRAEDAGDGNVAVTYKGRFYGMFEWMKKIVVPKKLVAKRVFEDFLKEVEKRSDGRIRAYKSNHGGYVLVEIRDDGVFAYSVREFKLIPRSGLDFLVGERDEGVLVEWKYLPYYYRFVPVFRSDELIEDVRDYLERIYKVVKIGRHYWILIEERFEVPSVGIRIYPGMNTIGYSAYVGIVNGYKKKYVGSTIEDVVDKMLADYTLPDHVRLALLLRVEKDNFVIGDEYKGVLRAIDLRKVIGVDRVVGGVVFSFRRECFRTGKKVWICTMKRVLKGYEPVDTVVYEGVEMGFDEAVEKWRRWRKRDARILVDDRAYDGIVFRIIDYYGEEDYELYTNGRVLLLMYPGKELMFFIPSVGGRVMESDMGKPVSVSA